jgi:hypothetical protein
VDLSSEVQKYALSVEGDTFYITGGVEKSVETNRTFRVKLSQKGFNLGADVIEFPLMIESRQNHVSFIEYGYLFIAFGKLYGNCFSQTLEYIDLKDPKSTFKQLRVAKERNHFFSECLLIPDKSYLGKDSAYLVIGGEQMKEVEEGGTRVSTRNKK